MTADDLDIDDIQRTLLCNADIPCGRLTMGDVWHDIKALALVAEVRRLRAIEDMARFVLAEHDIANTRPKADGNALGHAHRNPPRWDDRDGVCTWCVSVAALRHALGADRG